MKMGVMRCDVICDLFPLDHGVQHRVKGANSSGLLAAVTAVASMRAAEISRDVCLQVLHHNRQRSSWINTGEDVEKFISRSTTLDLEAFEDTLHTAHRCMRLHSEDAKRRQQHPSSAESYEDLRRLGLLAAIPPTMLKLALVTLRGNGKCFHHTEDGMTDSSAACYSLSLECLFCFPRRLLFKFPSLKRITLLINLSMSLTFKKKKGWRFL
ncbi:uncharacterized protein LOC121907340 [Thunnus maccoyii]|uniref:uncharacterized protein LOC121907340 n=1 Tax=Thunnus maccoyii TaxID=8240 RepID=UPI001C4CE186|nr:uncharacterized protein LOC121907340 [Thunnus maccoyii]